MECGAWITLAAVIVALGIGVASILHTQSMQKRERRERLLNEIIEWAVDITKTETRATEPQAEFLQKSKKNMLISLLLKYQAVNAGGEYIKVIAAKFGEDFRITVSGTAGKLHEHLGILKKQIQGKITAEERDEHWRSLIKSSVALTKKAAEIKAGAIGRREEVDSMPEKDILDRLERIEKMALPIALFCTGLPFLAIGVFDMLIFIRNVGLDPSTIFSEIGMVYLLIGIIFVGSAFALRKRITSFVRWLDIAIWVLVGMFFCIFVINIILRLTG